MHGSFEVGALKALVNNLDPIDVHYDFVSGVSVGAIIASAFSVYEFGQEKEAVDVIEKMFRKNEPFFEFWPGVVLEPFWKSSIIDPSNLFNILDDILKDKPW